MSTEIQIIPDYLKNMMETSDLSTANTLIGKIAVPRITTKGKIFRLKEGKEEIKIKGDLVVIVVGISPSSGYIKTFFSGDYSPGSTNAPDCSSQNGITPDNWCENIQAKNCARCPNNQWGSAVSMSGKKAKACKDSKHLHVALAENFNKDSKIYTLNVTVNSLKNLSAYGKTLIRKGLPTCAVITKVSFDDEAEVPRLIFEVLGIVKEEVAKISFLLASEKECKMPVAAQSNPVSIQKYLQDHISTIKMITDFVILGIVVIILMLTIIRSQYIECTSESGTLVRGLITMECVNENR